MGEKKASKAPGFEITLSGQELTQKESKGLKQLMVEDHVDMIGIAQLSFDAGELTWGDLNIGDDVEVKVSGGDRKLFVGVITGFRHSKNVGGEMLTVQAMDPLCKLGSSRHTQVFEETADSDVVNTILGDAGLEVGTVDSTDGTHAYIFQRNESDLAFLRRLAGRNGYRLQANEGKIDFIKVQYSDDPIELATGDLVSMDYQFSDQRIPSQLTVYGWDYVAKEKVEGTATSSDIDTIGSGDNAVEQTGQIWQDESWVSDVHVSSQDAAKAMAVGELNRLARGFLRGRIAVPGNAQIFAGVKIKVTGQRGGFNPEGFVISSRHIVEPSTGARTEFQFCGNTYPTD